MSVGGFRFLRFITFYAWLTTSNPGATIPAANKDRAGASNTYPTPNLLKLPAVGLWAILHNSLTFVYPQQLLLGCFVSAHRYEPESRR
jgi:hypothetical protein